MYRSIKMMICQTKIINTSEITKYKVKVKARMIRHPNKNFLNSESEDNKLFITSRKMVRDAMTQKIVTL